MREIKFRAKDFKGNWQYGTYAYGCFYPDSNRSHRIFPSGEYVDENTLGQFAGLEDKTGKEMFDGDIVYLDGFDSHGDFGEYTIEFKGTFKVEWRDEVAGFDLCRIDGTVDGWTLCEDSRHDLTVIGNIHDNPLMEVPHD